MKIPCKQCISYAMCVTKNRLSCELIYDYLYESNDGVMSGKKFRQLLNPIIKLFSPDRFSHSLPIENSYYIYFHPKHFRRW